MRQFQFPCVLFSISNPQFQWNQFCHEHMLNYFVSLLMGKWTYYIVPIGTISRIVPVSTDATNLALCRENPWC